MQQHRDLIHNPLVGGASQSAYISLLQVSLALLPQPAQVARVRHPLQRTHTQRLHVHIIHRVLHRENTAAAQLRPRLNLTLSCNHGY